MTSYPNALIALGLALMIAVGGVAAPTAASPADVPAVEAPTIQTQEEVTIHPLTQDNIAKTLMGYLIRDNGTGKIYLFDSRTVLEQQSEGDIPGYEEGEDAMTWFERYLNLPMDSGLGFGMGDLFDAVVTDSHIDVLRGVYWWD